MNGLRHANKDFNPTEMLQGLKCKKTSKHLATNFCMDEHSKVSVSWYRRQMGRGNEKTPVQLFFAKLYTLRLISIYWYFCSKIIQHSHAVLGTCPSISPSNVYFFSDYKKAHYFQGMDFNLNVCFHHFGVLGVTQRIKVIQVISKQILL